MKSQTGTLIIIGGHEDKSGTKLILKEVARNVGVGKIVVTTVASGEPEGIFEEYERVFRKLGVEHVFKLEIRSHEDAHSERSMKILEDANALFFTGGDQLKITSQLGNSPVLTRIREIHEEGGLIAGTSAGASVMAATMMVSGTGSESHRLGGSLSMASGLGLINDVIIDQHFAERGRIGRLLGAVAQNPRNIGIGIDENTAIVVDAEASFQVIGEGSVYVIDAGEVSFSNLTLEERERALSVFNARLHLLSQGDIFDLQNRQPEAHPAKEIEEQILDETWRG